MKKDFFKQLGTGVASLTFGVALSVFIYAAASGAINGMQALVLYAASFLLMLRFWWRYTELFVQFMPSHTFLQFLFDFLISFFGILAVLFVSAIHTWALLGAAAMVASAVRCGLSWKEAGDAKQKLKRTFGGSIVMLAVFAAVFFLAPAVEQFALASAVFILVLLFVLCASRMP